MLKSLKLISKSVALLDHFDWIGRKSLNAPLLWADGNGHLKDVQVNSTLQTFSPGATRLFKLSHLVPSQKVKSPTAVSHFDAHSKPRRKITKLKTDFCLKTENGMSTMPYVVSTNLTQRNHKTWFLQTNYCSRLNCVRKEKKPKIWKETLPWRGQRVNWHWR